MPYQARCRNGLHRICGPQDRRVNGGCAQCARINEARYRAACRNARRELRKLREL